MIARMDPNDMDPQIRCCSSGFAAKIDSFAVFMANALLPEWSKGVDLRPTVSPKRVGSNPTGRTVVPFVFLINSITPAPHALIHGNYSTPHKMRYHYCIYCVVGHEKACPACQSYPITLPLQLSDTKGYT